MIAKVSIYVQSFDLKTYIVREGVFRDEDWINFSEYGGTLFEKDSVLYITSDVKIVVALTFCYHREDYEKFLVGKAKDRNLPLLLHDMKTNTGKRELYKRLKEA